jgi:hypothetical protein
MQKTEAYERNKGKKENRIDTKSDIIIIHLSSMKKENTETHPMACHNIFFHHHNHPHMLSEGGEVADVCIAPVNNFFFFLSKDNIIPRTKQLLLKNYHEMTNWPMQRCFEIFHSKDDRIIALF